MPSGFLRHRSSLTVRLCLQANVWLDGAAGWFSGDATPEAGSRAMIIGKSEMSRVKALANRPTRTVMTCPDNLTWSGLLSRH
jgi:hypothetical protein